MQIQNFYIQFRRLACKAWNLFICGELLLSRTQKKNLRKIKKKADRRARYFEYHLLNLGFTERALNDLYKMVNENKKPYYRQYAALVLARWYANKHNIESKNKCLDMLGLATKREVILERRIQAAIMEAECHNFFGNSASGINSINRVLKTNENANLYLALANFESNVQDRVKRINQAFNINNLTDIVYNSSSYHHHINCLEPKKQASKTPSLPSEKIPIVSVIIVANDVKQDIRMALKSILLQTWTNIEVLVVDNFSTEETISVIEEYCSSDDRVRVIQSQKSMGPYVAKNIALKEAKGTFVTCQDVNEWCHPQKIEKQVLHLIQNPKIIANTTKKAYITSELMFYLEGRKKLIEEEASSLMFRREPVIREIGYWDCVISFADSEFLQRLKIHFGSQSHHSIQAEPLSFIKRDLSSDSYEDALKADDIKIAAKNEYNDCMNYFHQTATNLYYHFPQNARPFAVPKPLLPEYKAKENENRHFDVIIASEFRLPGGTNSSNAEEIKAQQQLGLKTGLVQLSHYKLDANLSTNRKIRSLIDGEQVQMVIYGEKVSCDCLIIKLPSILKDKQRLVPEVSANNIVVIANQTPQRDYGIDNRVAYNITVCESNLKEYFGTNGQWFPISPQVRDTFIHYHKEELDSITLSAEDWVEIIDIENWRRQERPARTSSIRIGRHGRDIYLKWPENPEDLLAIYPEEENFEVHLLGGADTPVETLGYLPRNWNVLPFGSISPKDFLAKMDVFVYYTHPDMVEAFGRVIIESMAVGVPVILPPVFENLFGEAAVYAEPANVKDNIKELMNNDYYYNTQVQKAHSYVEKHFGYQKHAERLRALSVSI